ncbi:MAG: HAMP domain-containing protein [Desulfobulbaceae bacterium]|nr:HAMP domain-containing protein [Desulfobulbaceae bacterium]
MHKLRLFWQIFPVCAGISLLSVLLVGWLANSTGRDFFISELNRNLSERIKLLQPTVTALAQRGADEQLQDFIRNTGRQASTRITIIDAAGVVLTDSSEDHTLMDNHASRPEVALALAGKEGRSRRGSRTLRESMLYVAQPVLLQEGQRPGVLRLAISTASYDQHSGSFTSKIVLICLVVPVLAAILSVLSARRISRPLEEMKRGAEQLAVGRFDLPTRINVDHMTVEMAGLANAINQMAEQIHQRVRIIIQQRNELEAVFSGMADSVVAIDADKNIIRMNQAASTLFMLPADSVKGRPAQGVVRNTQLLELIDYTLAHNSQQECQVTVFSGTDPITLQTHAMPLRDEVNNSVGVLLVMNDLTKLNRLENIRQDFVANVSHELKTPITVIKGYIETLLDGALAEQDTARNFLRVAAAQANRLDAIVDDLLTLSRIEDKTDQNVVTSPASAQQVLENAVEACVPLAEEKGIQLEVECAPELRAPMNQPLLEQAVINLLNNAIAYSSAGGTVLLRCRESEKSDGGKLLHLSVIDKGPGIAKEHLPRIFERFYRPDKARSRDMGGTGLGLAIVKHIVQAHQGTVEVESILGKGSTFTITLPGMEERVVEEDL